MSNSLVGQIYQQVIDDVLDASRTDFQDGGVDESVLEELRQGWQRKLSQMGVASFPWEPKPEAAAPAQTQLAPAGASQTGAYPMGVPQPSLQTPPAPLTSIAPSDSGMKPEPGVNIKPEPASGPSGIPPSVPAYTVPRGPGAERAIQNIENQFGSRAATSINTIRSGLGQSTAPGPQGSQVHIPNPQAQYQQQRMAPQQQQQRTQPQPNSLAASQMDGAVDDDASPLEAVVLRRSPEGNTVELGRLEIDSLIRAQIEANARRMEGGGLMLPLKRTSKIKASRGSAPAGLRGQVDGPGDDDLKSEDADLDAINSDLDDPEDNKDSSDEDDDGLGHIMLCMYDKVQRVKNKWKCTLKDGVLTVNGKEYVFHKATGEYEW